MPIDKLRKALAPFAAFAEAYPGHDGDTLLLVNPETRARITVGDMRRAARALKNPSPAGARRGAKVSDEAKRR